MIKPPWMIAVSSWFKASKTLILIGLVVVALLIVFSLIRTCTGKESVNNKIHKETVDGMSNAASDATQITGNALDGIRDSDDLTRSNEDAIRKANGDPDQYIRSLCLRTVNKNKPQCIALQQSGAKPAK